jgi:hypothetical protein
MNFSYLIFISNIIILTFYNNTYPKVAVQWLNQALCFYQSFSLVDSESLRDNHLRVAANRQTV